MRRRERQLVRGTGTDRITEFCALNGKAVGSIGLERKIRSLVLTITYFMFELVF